MRSAAAAALAGLLLVACDGKSADAPVQGYVEGEYVIVAAPSAGWLDQVAVQEGDTVHPNELLFRLDPTEEQAARDAAKAELAAAEATLGDLLTGKRPPEIDAIQAQLAEANAQLVFATTELQRNEKLVQTNAGARRGMQEARMNRDMLQARIDELEADIAIARLPARDDQIKAQQAHVQQLEAQLVEAQWRLDQRSVTSRVAGRVEEVVRRTGEYAPADGPVLRILPPDALKVRFFVPQARLTGLEPGREVPVTCDGCPSGLKARVSFIATDVEFTPPVIYSVQARQKLALMVEARLPAGSPLRPGQPVDVSLP